jgi:hypothetical protein
VCRKWILHPSGTGININIKPRAGVFEDETVHFEFKTPVVRYLMIDMDFSEKCSEA